MICIAGTSINDVWHRAVYNCWKKGTDYVVEQGSNVGQIRRQLDYFVCEIIYPETRPLAITFPENIHIPTPNMEHMIEDYAVNYLLSDIVSDNEEYTYGERILSYLTVSGPTDTIIRVNQLKNVIEKLKQTGNTNQATIEIGSGNDILLADPPCLRVIDLKILNGELNMSVYFRSWDLWSGFPTNLGGLQILNEYIAQEIGVNTGKLFAASAGVHLYEMYFDIVKQRFNEI